MMIALTPLLLPERRAPSETADEDAREFTVEMVVTGRARRSRAAASRRAGLRNLQGVYLVEVERDGHRDLVGARPTRSWPSGDRLTFAGNVDRILDLQGMRGLALGRGAPLRRGRLVDRATPLRGRHRPRLGARRAARCSEAGFRGRYGGAVIAIHRADERVARQARRGAPARRATSCWCSPARPSGRAPSTGATSSVVAALDGDGAAARGEGAARRPGHRRRCWSLAGTGRPRHPPGGPPRRLRASWRCGMPHAHRRPATPWTST